MNDLHQNDETCRSGGHPCPGDASLTCGRYSNSDEIIDIYQASLYLFSQSLLAHLTFHQMQPTSTYGSCLNDAPAGTEAIVDSKTDHCIQIIGTQLNFQDAMVVFQLDHPGNSSKQILLVTKAYCAVSGGFLMAPVTQERRTRLLSSLGDYSSFRGSNAWIGLTQVRI